MRLIHWLYLAIGSLAMLAVCVIAGEWALAALSGAVLATAGWRFAALRRDPDS